MTEESIRIGVIGGSGLYDIDGLSDTQELNVSTPFGMPSDSIMVGTLEGVRVAFVARHGRGHCITPTEINARANIFALKTLGVEQIVAVSACGSLRSHIRPGDIVVPDQLFDFTKKREYSFFGRGLVAHIGVADPFCARLSSILISAVREAGGTAHDAGCYITIEGPRFSTKAESRVYQSWGMDLIGMTTSPEAFLAREAEICYAVMGHVTDYDVWHETEDPVSVSGVLETLAKNTRLAQDALRILVRELAASGRNCECDSALAVALITNPQVVPQHLKNELHPLVGKYLKP